MKRVRRAAKQVLVHVVNLISFVLGDDKISSTIRIFFFNLAGNHISYQSMLLSRVYVRGSGLTVEAGCLLNWGVNCDLSAPIVIREGSKISHGTSFITALHDEDDDDGRHLGATGAPIVIGPHARIGANVTILAGVTIGLRAKVCVCATVTKDVRPYTMVAGSPARFVKFVGGSSPGAPKMESLVAAPEVINA